MHAFRSLRAFLLSLLSSSLLLAAPSWQSLGGNFQGKPFAVLGSDGRLEVFGRGADNALWFAAQTTPGGAWTPLVSLGGVIISNPAAISDISGRISVFALGTDSAVWTRSQITPGTDTYSEWTSIGGQGTSDLAVVQAFPNSFFQMAGRAELFMRGPDYSLWHTYQTNASDSNWSAWSSLGGYLTSAPDAGVNPNLQNTAFVRGGDNALWFIHETAPGSNTWTNWASLGGSLNGPPHVSVITQNQEDVIYRGTDNGAWFILETEPSGPSGPTSWSNQVSVGGYIISNPTMAPFNQTSAYTNDLEIFAVGSDNALWVTVSHGMPYEPWQKLGTFSNAVISDPFAVRNQDGTIDVFAIGPGGPLQHIRQSAPGSWQ